MSDFRLCVRNTFLDTPRNTDGSQPIRVHRCTSAPAVLSTIDISNEGGDDTYLHSGQIGFLLAHVVVMQGEEERTRQALCELQDLNSLLEVQVRVARERCYVAATVLSLIRNDGSIHLHRTWCTFYSCCARHLHISITQLMFGIYGALAVNKLRQLRMLCERMAGNMPLCVHDIQTILDALASQAPMQILVLERRCRFQRIRLLTPGSAMMSRPFGRGVELYPRLWSIYPMVLFQPGHDASYVLVCNLFG